MKWPFPWILIAGFLFLGFLFFIVLGVMNKNKSQIFIASGFLSLTFATSIWIIYSLTIKSYHKLAEVLRLRDGIEIYTALFGKPVSNCLTVINKADQIIPRLDCCIWLEFETCPLEMNRIISLEDYSTVKYISSDTSFNIPDYSPKPAWWTPSVLSDSVIVMQSQQPDNPNRVKISIFAEDSSHVFYCDMAD